MLRTRRERVNLLRKGVDSSTIENLYLNYNNFKLVRQPVLFDPLSGKIPIDMCKPSQFEGKKVEVTHEKQKLLLIIGLMVFAILFPIRVLFALIMGLLFIPPVLVVVIITYEFGSIISKEMEKLSALQKFSMVISR